MVIDCKACDGKAAEAVEVALAALNAVFKNHNEVKDNFSSNDQATLDRLVGLGGRCVLVRGNADRELVAVADGGASEHPESEWAGRQLRPDRELGGRPMGEARRLSPLTQRS